MSGRRNDDYDADEVNARIDQNLDAITAMLNEMDGVAARWRHPAIRLVSSDEPTVGNPTVDEPPVQLADVVPLRPRTGTC